MCSTVIAVRAIVFDRIVEVVVQQATAALRALGVTHDRIEPFVILSASETGMIPEKPETRTTKYLKRYTSRNPAAAAATT